MNVLLAALLALQADGAVKTAVERGRAWLVAQQKDDGTFPSHYMSAGKQALVLWTLLECGLPADDKAAAKTLAYLRANGDPEKTQTHHANYAASMTLVTSESFSSAPRNGLPPSSAPSAWRCTRR